MFFDEAHIGVDGLSDWVSVSKVGYTGARVPFTAALPAVVDIVLAPAP